jgi:hypothetical protein
MRVQETAEAIGATVFLGVPTRDFERGGREQLIYLLQAGLNPDSRLADLGCGVLRAGYWLIHFLDSGCYCGIEPHAGRLDLGMHQVLEPETLSLKQPRFDTNATFDTSVFGERFDFFLAYSVWTHASKRQIALMLDAFVRDTADDATFLTTYMPASWIHPAYDGDRWYGTSHESDVPGCIYHSRQWIGDQCDARELTVRRLGRDRTHRQTWLEITRRRAGAAPRLWRDGARGPA